MLFTDLVGSTELMAQLGDDRAEMVRRTHFRLLRETVAGHGGQEVKSLGDGLMVFFSSAVEAVACAVAVQRSVQRYNRQHEDHQLRARIGLHVGEPIRDEGDYFGKAVVIARRLCDRAEGGQIIASDLVHSLAGSRGSFTFTSLGLLALRGLADPVPAWDIAWLKAAARPLPLPQSLSSEGRTKFVGRKELIDRLRDAWERARAGGLQLVLVAGEAGIGKTRLAMQFAGEAHGTGGRVLYGRADEDTLVPYQPFVETLRYYLRQRPAEELYGMTPVAGSLARLIPELADRARQAPAAAADPETERYQLFEALASLVRQSAEAAPTVLVLDDLHWADKPSLLLLTHLLRSTTESSLLVIVIYRDTDLGRRHPLAELLASLRREVAHERLQVGGLTSPEVAELIEDMAQRDLDPDLQALAAAVYEETEGHPFFIEEVFRHLVETGNVTDGEVAPPRRRLRLSDLGIPEGVRDLIGRRLARLSDDCNAALAVGAVLGPSFSVDLLERVGEIPSDNSLGLIEQALDARLIEELPHSVGHYTFAHALVRETIYDEIPSARRLRLHARAAAAIEAAHTADVEMYLSELAHHFAAAGHAVPAAKAIDYGTRAGARAVAVLAYEEAVGYFQRALAALEHAAPVDERQHCDLLLALADSQWRSGETESANVTYERAAAAARKLGAAELFARAALGVAPGFMTLPFGTYDARRIGLLEEALKLLGERSDPLRARVLGELARGLLWSEATDAYERRDALSREAVELARQSGDTATRAATLYTRHLAAWRPENAEERLKLAEEILALAAEAGDRDMDMNGRILHLVDQLELGGLPVAEAESFADHARELRQPLYLWYAAVWKTMIALMEGRFADAEILAAEAMGAGQGSHNARQGFGLHLFILRREQGRLADLEPALKGYAESFPAVPGWRAALATAYLEQDRFDDLRREFELLAADNFDRIPRDSTWQGTMALIAEMCAALSDFERAAVLHELLQPFVDRNLVVSYGIVSLGPGARYVGLLKATTGQLEGAITLLRQAIAVSDAMGALPHVARTRLDLAECLTRRNAAGDSAEVQSLTESVARDAAALGMAGLEQRASTIGSALKQ